MAALVYFGCYTCSLITKKYVVQQCVNACWLLPDSQPTGKKYARCGFTTWDVKDLCRHQHRICVVTISSLICSWAKVMMEGDCWKWLQCQPASDYCQGTELRPYSRHSIKLVVLLLLTKFDLSRISVQFGEWKYSHELYTFKIVLIIDRLES